jgi:hypothetical protein
VGEEEEEEEEGGGGIHDIIGGSVCGGRSTGCLRRRLQYLPGVL